MMLLLRAQSDSILQTPEAELFVLCLAEIY